MLDNEIIAVNIYDLLWQIGAIRVENIIHRDMLQVGDTGHVDIGKLCYMRSGNASYDESI